MKKKLLLFCFVLACSVSIFASDTLLTYHNGDFASLKQRAQTEGKLVMIEFYIDHCGACVKLEKQTLNNTKLASFISNKYIPFRIDGLSIADEGIELAQKYQVRAYPTMVVIDAKGNLVKTLEGFFTPNILMAELGDPYHDSRAALFTTIDPADAKGGRVLKTVLPEKSAAKASGNALAIFFSAYALEVAEYASYGEAQDVVRIWEIPWDGEIWIIPMGQGRHKVVLGPLDSKAEAEDAQKRMLEEHNLESVVLDLANML
ncbi:MAG: thioredoxin fold domain-containing protein [Bacteroidia bacterium]